MLRTQRLVLRPYVEDDRDAFVALNTDPIVREHMDGPLDPDQASGLFDRMLGTSDALHAYAITDAECATYVGHVFVQLDGADGELGFVLVPTAWGRGIASEAARALADHVLDTVPGVRLLGTVDLDHPASARVLEKAGFAFLEQRTDEQGPYAVYARSLSG